jgi:hypothetical protein
MSYSKGFSYSNVNAFCIKYCCTILTDQSDFTNQNQFMIRSRCGHNSVVSFNKLMKHKDGVLCLSCHNTLINSGIATCIECDKIFQPTKTTFLYCGPKCGNSRVMTEEKREKIRNSALLRIEKYVSEDGTLKSADEIKVLQKRKRDTQCTEEDDGTEEDGSIDVVKRSKSFVKYATIKHTYESCGCKLLTTEDEYLTARNDVALKGVWFDIISVCGHPEKSLYYSFTESDTCLYCKACTHDRAKNLLSDMARSPYGNSTSLMTQKHAIDIVKEMCLDMFEIVKTKDGCDSDILVRPKGVTNDSWLKVKLKSTLSDDNDIKFRIPKIHNSVYLMISITSKEMWIFTPDKLLVRTYYMQTKRSVYIDHFVECINDLKNKLSDLYITSTYNHPFIEANKPISPAMQLEYHYIIKRETILDFFPFERNEVTGAVYNFKIGNTKFQENTFSCQMGKKSMCASLSKNAGRVNGQAKRQPYEVGDNDFYWLNKNDGTLEFYVIPEFELKKYYLKTSLNEGKMYLGIGEHVKWIEKYKFCYSTIRTNDEKLRLCELIGFVLSV